MSRLDAPLAPPPAPAWRDRTLLQWLGTGNPFYVVSAGLFLIGLRLAFGSQTREVDTWALMTGLSGYTLLLAAAALLLVRFAGAWDDLRTVLLLVVLMFLATSVTFDELLVLRPRRGTAVYLAGLAFAVAVSEGLLRGIRLRLPAGFRGPYYLTLALFFLYPLALSPLLPDPHGEPLLWGLFGFLTAAGLVFLTLLPAVRRGPGYVGENGSPWAWPFYPWSLFVFLGVAVVGRSFLLCWSLHLVGGRDADRVVFGPYFLVPFGLAVAALLLELGIVARRREVQWAALGLVAGLVALAGVGHRSDPVYAEFLNLFVARLGGTPLFLALLLAAGFYLYALLRRVPGAVDAFALATAGLAVVGPDSLTVRDLTPVASGPLVAAAGLLVAVGVRRRDAWRCLAAGVGLAVAGAVLIPDGLLLPGGRGLVAAHLILAAVLVVGAAFDDPAGRALRAVGAAVVLLACLTVEAATLTIAVGQLPWPLAVYPLVMAGVLAGYALLIRRRVLLAAAGAAAVGWVVVTGGRGYLALRDELAGLDYLVTGLVLLPVAVLISLAKAGALTRRPAADRPAEGVPG